MSEPRKILDIKELSVTRTNAPHPELDQLTITIDAGETLVLIGENDSGKEAFLRALGGFTARGENLGGTIRFGNDEEGPAHRTKNSLRTSYLPGVGQMPLNRHREAAGQLARVLSRKTGSPVASALEELRIALGRLDGAPTLEELERVPGEIPALHLALGLLAAATASIPELVLCDAPFADLSPSGARILADALKKEQQRLGFAIVYAARGVNAATLLDGRIAVMRAGKLIEEGNRERLQSGQTHSHTQSLFKAEPKLSQESAPPRTAGRGGALLQVQGLELTRDETARATSGLTFELRRGASLAFVGEEGSGRRAMTRAVLGLDPVAQGRVVLDAVDLGILSEKMAARLRRRIAFITGSDDSLDPRMSVWDTVDEPLRAHLRLPRHMIGEHRDAALKRVGLSSLAGNLPVSSLNAFDKRRLQVARAIVSAPHLCVVDEPLLGLDTFGQMIVRDLLKDFRLQEGPAFLVITANFAIAQSLADDAFVFHQGRVVERGPIHDMVRAPKEAPTRALIEAVTGIKFPVEKPAEPPAETAAQTPAVEASAEPAVSVEEPPKGPDQP